MPEADALELFGASRVRSSERIRSLDMSTEPGRPHCRTSGVGEAASMLLSFERPARRRRVRGPMAPGRRADAPRLFADLENCTVANETGITGRGSS
jgi:hypothetical protein